MPSKVILCSLYRTTGRIRKDIKYKIQTFQTDEQSKAKRHILWNDQ